MHNILADLLSYLVSSTDKVENYTNNVFEDLQEIEEGNAKLDEITRIVMTAVKVVVGVAAFATGAGEVSMATKIVCGVVSATADIAIDAGLTYGLPNDKNTIAMRQCSNYGTISAAGSDDARNGLVGNNGDQVLIEDCVNAGNAAMYQITDQATGQSRQTRRILCVGYGSATNKDPNVECKIIEYTDKSTASDFASKSIYSENFNIDSTYLWNIVSGAAFAQPYCSNFADDFVPTTNAYSF